MRFLTVRSIETSLEPETIAMADMAAPIPSRTGTKNRPEPSGSGGPGPAAAARRRRLAPAERLPQILDAALQEFAERGYAGARMAAVAERAGVAKGLIYHYIPSKAELFKAVVRGCCAPVFDEASRMVGSFDGPRAELLRGLIGYAYSHIAGNARERVLLRLLLAEGKRFPELTEFYHEEVLARSAALLRVVVESGVARGEFRPTALVAAPHALMGPAIFATVWKLLFGDRHALDLGTLREAHLDLVLHGLLAAPAASPTV